MDPIRQDLQYLTGPETAGRLSGTEGARLASAYLAESLQELGLTPAGDDGFFQGLEVPAARLTGPARLVVDGIPYRYRRDLGDDSVAFQAAGLPALGLGQMSTEPSPAQFHSPDDTNAVIHLPVIQAGAESIISLLHRLAVHPAMAA